MRSVVDERGYIPIYGQRQVAWTTPNYPFMPSEDQCIQPLRRARQSARRCPVTQWAGRKTSAPDATFMTFVVGAIAILHLSVKEICKDSIVTYEVT